MPYNEDAQPNEVRHARKGNTVVPAIRSTVQPRVGPQAQRGRGFASRPGPHRGRGFASRGGPPKGRGGYTPRGSSRERGKHNGQARGSAHGYGPRDPTRANSQHQTFSRGGNSQNSGYNSRRPAKKPKLEDSQFQRGDVAYGFSGSSNGLTGRAVTLDDSNEFTPSTSYAMRMSDAYPLPGHTSNLLPASDLMSTLDTRQKGLCVPRCASAHLPGHSASHKFDAGTVVEMDSATSFDSLQLGQVDEENVMPLAVSPPRQTAFSSSDLSLDSSIPPSNVEPALQPMATIVVEHSQSAISSHLKNPAFTSTAKGVPKFRSGRLRFELPRRQHVNSDGPMTSNAHQSTTFQALQSERRSVSPEYPDIHELLRDNVVEDAGPISGNQGPATPDPDAVELVLMRVDPHDKPRHLFVLPSPSGVLSVTMRGSFDLVEQEPLRRTALRTAGMSEEARQLIDDACLLRSSQGHVVALGRVGDAQQLSVVRILDKVVTDVGTFDRPTQPGKKGGISAICGLPQAGSFATGGYDHIVHRWSLEEHLATPARLPIRHTSTIQSLLHLRDSSDKLLSGSADCSVTVYDISAERVINSLKLSNSVYQVHAAPSPSCALLEVGHRELQFEVRDLRLVPTASVVRFGYPNVKVHGRYTRGAVRDHIFACGGSEKDGCVRLWDLRKPSEVLKSIQCFPGRKAIQIAFDGAQMIACSEDHQLALLAHNL